MNPALKTTINKSCTLIEFLTGQYPDSPRTRIKKLLQSGSVRVNDKQVTLHSFMLSPGDNVEILRQVPHSAGSELPFPILYEDKDVIVVDKPAGRPTSSTDGSLSIQTVVSGYLKIVSKGKLRAFVVHRLDKEVSGVLLFAKSVDAMQAIKDSWKETEKHYYALVEGIPGQEEGTISSWLIEDKSQKVHSTSSGVPDAKFAITHYRILKLVGEHTLLDIKTDTGRKNQIRVHLSDIRCPIVGDRKYGASDTYKRRVRLHAWSLSFQRPFGGGKITITSPMPEGFLSLKKRDEHYK
ncbi:MAG: RluA family pseudouridine synthase [Bacteroidales bacterium]